MTQAVNLANFANNVDSSGGLNPLALNAAVPVSRGGTGVTTSAAIASTFAAAFGNLLFPVGSIYINATSSTNPGTLLGFGTWVAFGAGRVPVGFDGTNPLFDTAEETGGSADAIVVSHTHTGSTSSAGAASGTLNGGNPGDFGSFKDASGVFSTSNGLGNRPQGSAGTGSNYTANLSIPDHTHSVSITASGTAGTNANYQPYITVYMWKRTA